MLFYKARKHTQQLALEKAVEYTISPFQVLAEVLAVSEYE
jgi:hypothetical protein